MNEFINEGKVRTPPIMIIKHFVLAGVILRVSVVRSGDTYDTRIIAKEHAAAADNGRQVVDPKRRPDPGRRGLLLGELGVGSHSPWIKRKEWELDGLSLGNGRDDDGISCFGLGSSPVRFRVSYPHVDVM